MSDEIDVMIVDDNVQILDLLREVLEDKGLKAIACSSAQEGLQFLRTRDVKLILLDLAMPEMNGVEMFKKIIELNPSSSVIMMTGTRDMESIRECMKHGARDFIKKPFDFEYLKTAVLVEIIPQT